MVSFLPGRSALEQGTFLQGGTSWSRIREQRRTTWVTNGWIRRGLQVSIVVVRRMGRSSRRRQATGDSRTAGFRAKSSQWSILAGSSGESVCQVSTGASASTREYLLIYPSCERPRMRFFSRLLLVFSFLQGLKRQIVDSECLWDLPKASHDIRTNYRI